MDKVLKEDKDNLAQDKVVQDSKDQVSKDQDSLDQGMDLVKDSKDNL